MQQIYRRVTRLWMPHVPVVYLNNIGIEWYSLNLPGAPAAQKKPSAIIHCRGSRAH